MKRTMHRIYWVWDFDKEEAWLNEMAAKGLALSDAGFCRYTFEETDPGAYAVRLELLDFMPSAKQGQDYIRFVEETGAEYVGKCLRWAYFRKQTTDGGFDLFSDLDSRVKHFNRILFLIGCLMPLLIFNVINMFFSSAMQGDWVALVGGGLNLLLALLCGYGFIRLLLKRRRLKAERTIHE